MLESLSQTAHGHVSREARDHVKKASLESLPTGETETQKECHSLSVHSKLHDSKSCYQNMISDSAFSAVTHLQENSEKEKNLLL